MCAYLVVYGKSKTVEYLLMNKNYNSKRFVNLGLNKNKICIK